MRFLVPFYALVSSICRQIPGAVELLLHRFRQLLHELFAVLVPQQILDGLLLQTGGFLHGVDSSLNVRRTVRNERAALRCGDTRQLTDCIVADCKACLLERSHLDEVYIVAADALTLVGLAVEQDLFLFYNFVRLLRLGFNRRGQPCLELTPQTFVAYPRLVEQSITRKLCRYYVIFTWSTALLPQLVPH